MHIAQTPGEALSAFDPELVIISPGYRPDHPLHRWAVGLGVPVWSDVELAWRVADKFGERPIWLSVTGTNGKTTTTQLAAHLIAAQELRTATCGNIGTPVLDAVRDPARFEVLVVELSSFQLHSVRTVAPWASVVLNVDLDHIDWHGSYEAYRAAKGVAYERTDRFCIYNKGDTTTRTLVEEADVAEGCRAIGFGLDAPGPSEIGIVDDRIVDRAFLEERASKALEVASVSALRAHGMGARHLLEDALAAIALARSVGVEPETIDRAIVSFHPDHHRNEPVAIIDGVAYVDDSKATNAHAANASLAAYDPVVWIVGGLLKGVDISPLVAKHASRLRAAIVIGRERGEVARAFAEHAPQVPLVEIDSGDTDSVMALALEAASSRAVRGDTVLLAPAAASMDQFSGYAERGREFAEAVRRLGGERS